MTANKVVSDGRKPYRSQLRATVVITIAWAIAPVAVSAQDYPTRPIRVVVPVTPGGTNDALARIVGDKLSARFGQSVVIENKPGAGMHLGTEAVLRSQPDGYTLLASPSGPLAVSQSLYPKLGFDPSTFVAVSVLAKLPYVLVVNPKLRVANVAELVAYARAHPGKLNYASPGTGSSSQLATEWLKILAGLRITHVPYRGSAPALTDLIAGHVDLMIDNLGNSAQHIADGKLRALAVASEARTAELPEVPTIADTFPGFVASSWFAMVAPPKTPPAIADKLSQAIAEALHAPDTVKRLRDLGATPVGGSPAETAAFIRAEAERWRRVIVEAEVRPD
jgi:tripartite-type tricarboxylate transporter receptor subunit TctC